MIRLLIDDTRFPDEALNEDIVCFPLVDTLPPVRYSCQDRPPKPRDTPVTLEQLRAHREALNLLVLSGVKELPYSDEVFDITCEDAEQGFMSEPVPIDTVDLSQVSLTRRIPVRELRAKGWRTRTVDHATESLINDATKPTDRVRHDTVDVLITILLSFLAAARSPRMWKRFVSEAFRRCPIAEAPLDLSWVIFMALGRTWVSQHLGMPFGAASAVCLASDWEPLGLGCSHNGACSLSRYLDDVLGASLHCYSRRETSS